MTRLLLTLLISCSTFSAWCAPGNAATAAKGHPQLFLENKGQVHGPDNRPLPQVLYHLAGGGVNVSLTAQSIHYTFIKQIENAAAAGANQTPVNEDASPVKFESVGMDIVLEGANPSARITASGQQEYYENHFTATSNKPGGLTYVRSYERVTYHDVYPHIDWVVYVSQGAAATGVKYDFIVYPGGNPDDIRLKYKGATALSLTKDGGIVARTELGELQESRPYSYHKETSNEIASKYILHGDVLRYSVEIPASGTLVIDPQVRWATYFGGNSSDDAQNVACNKDGELYVCGSTYSTSNLATFGSHKYVAPGGEDAYLAKFNASGILLWATYFGGSNLERCWALAIDTARGDVYIGGQTRSTTGLATLGSHQTILNKFTTANPQAWDGYIAKFTSAGALLWATYYGGEDVDQIYAAACDPQGNLYVGGYTKSDSGIGTTGTFKPFHQYAPDSLDGFLAKFDTGGHRLWGTYFGAAGADEVFGLCTDRLSNVFITGYTFCRANIATTGSFQPAKSDSSFYTVDAFLAKFNTSGSRLWSTYYGGAHDDQGTGVSCDSAGNVYLCGVTWSPTGMSSAGAHQTFHGGGLTDGFLAKFSSTGARRWGTYYGGQGYEGITASLTPFGSPPFGFINNINLKWSVSFAHGKVWLCGLTTSTSAIATACAYQVSNAGDVDAFIASFDTSGFRLWGTYYGGPGRDYGIAIAGTDAGDVFMAGITESSAGIATSGANQTSLDGLTDGFLARLFDSTTRLRLQNVQAHCAGDTFSVGSYLTTCGSLRPGNTFTVQLSNSSGVFSPPVTIGTLGSLTPGSVLCTIPAGASGTGYKLRMVSSAPAMISDTAAITIYALPQPAITKNGSVLSTATGFTSYQWYKNGAIIPGATSSSYTPTTNGQYKVTVTNANGCKATSFVFIFSLVGIAGVNALQDVKVYPVPMDDYLTVEDAERGTELVITNLLGQQLMKAEISARHQQLDVRRLPAGAYVLTLSNNNGGKKTFPILKQ